MANMPLPPVLEISDVLEVWKISPTFIKATGGCQQMLSQLLLFLTRQNLLYRMTKMQLFLLIMS